MRYDFTVFHTAGKELIVPDTLSRAPIHVDGVPDELEEETTAYVRMCAESTPASPGKLAEIRGAQEADPVCRQLEVYVNTEWPDRQNLPVCCKPYWQHRHEISIQEGSLTRASRIVIPKVLQQD